MTGDQLYDRTKQMLREDRSTASLYWVTKLLIKVYLMEKVPQPAVYQWKKAS